ncbi:hypothetical protein ACOSQ2_023993 [Xanthoceras sorbifolium]
MFLPHPFGLSNRMTQRQQKIHSLNSSRIKSVRLNKALPLRLNELLKHRPRLLREAAKLVWKNCSVNLISLGLVNNFESLLLPGLISNTETCYRKWRKLGSSPNPPTGIVRAALIPSLLQRIMKSWSDQPFPLSPVLKLPLPPVQFSL